MLLDEGVFSLFGPQYATFYDESFSSNPGHMLFIDPMNNYQLLPLRRKIMVKRKGTKALVAALLAVALVVPWQAANAASVSGVTNVTLSIPGSIILSYMSALTLTFTAGYAATSSETGPFSAALPAIVASPVFNAAITTTAVGSAPTTLV
jgi:fatty acid desaturase